MTSSPPKLDVLDVIEGHLVGQTLLQLLDLGVIDALHTPRKPADVADERGLDATMLERVLTWVAARTTLIEAQADRFVAAAMGDSACFSLRQYVGAYGPVAGSLAQILTRQIPARSMLDTKRHAEAFAGLSGTGVGVLTEVVATLRPRVVLDLGCGTGGLLRQLAQGNTAMRGWGIDHSEAMCREARRRAQGAEVAERLRFVCADAMSPPDWPMHVRLADVDVVVASSLLNELATDAERVGWLRALAQALPERLVVISDYYGRLGHGPPPWPRRVALHDFVQCISGQGIPPHDAQACQAIYRQAGVTLVHGIEDTQETGFVHLVRL